MQKGITVFRWELFVSQCRTQETFCVSENFRYRKILWIRKREEVSKFSVEYFLSYSAENFIEEPFCVSQNFWYRKRVMSWFSVEFFLSRSTEKLRRGTLLCCVSENFRQRKSLWIKGGGREGISRFSVKNFCLTVPKNFVEETFCVSKNFWYRKMLGIREGAGITIFRQNYFVSQYRII